MEAVKNRGLALKFACEKFKSDKEIIHAACNNRNGNLGYLYVNKDYFLNYKNLDNLINIIPHNKLEDFLEHVWRSNKRVFRTKNIILHLSLIAFFVLNRDLVVGLICFLYFIFSFVIFYHINPSNKILIMLVVGSVIPFCFISESVISRFSQRVRKNLLRKIILSIRKMN